MLVNGHFGGVLRYLGTVAGKEGLYCGVELDQRVGKNDGTYGGKKKHKREGRGQNEPCTTDEN